MTAVAGLTLALGIGANTAIFSVIYAVLLKPLVFPEADRLVKVWMAFPERNIQQTSWSHDNFWDARDMADAFEDGAGLLLRSFAPLLSVHRGFQADRRVLVEINLPRSTARTMVPAPGSSCSISKRASQPPRCDLGRVRQRPAHLSRGSTGMDIVAADRPDGEIPWAGWRLITGGHFRTMGVPLLKGRTFNERDLIARPWRVIVSERLAALLWPGADPVGRQAILWRGQGNLKAEVIGVVGNMRERGIADAPTLAVYLPVYGSGAENMHFVIQTSTSAEAITLQVRAALSDIDPALPLSNVETLEQIVSQSTASRRFTVVLLSAFSGVALALALVGIFGVTSYSVSRQTADIGVRLALGASHGHVLRAVVLDAMKPVAAGILAGVAATAALSRLIASLLFEVTARDPATYVMVIALLATTALIACVLPARQALRVDVVAALRAE